MIVSGSWLAFVRRCSIPNSLIGELAHVCNRLGLGDLCGASRQHAAEGVAWIFEVLRDAKGHFHLGGGVLSQDSLQANNPHGGDGRVGSEVAAPIRPDARAQGLCCIEALQDVFEDAHGEQLSLLGHTGDIDVPPGLVHSRAPEAGNDNINR